MDFNGFPDREALIALALPIAVAFGFSGFPREHPGVQMPTGGTFRLLGALAWHLAHRSPPHLEQSPWAFHFARRASMASRLRLIDAGPMLEGVRASSVAYDR